MTAPEELSDLPYADLLRPYRGPLEIEGDYDTVHFDHRAFEPGGADEPGEPGEQGEQGGPGGRGGRGRPRATGSRFLESALTDCVLTDADLRNCRFNDVWVSATRFTGVSLADTDWLDSALLACSLAGVEAFGSVLRRVTFRRCKLDSVNLRSAGLHDVVFEDCVLREVDLAEATLDSVSFPGTRLERVRLGRATVKKADLRGATAIDLADGYEALRGALITSTQLLDLAPALAQTLGITVKDR
ncbi:pentapeptide repeat-containing protein [Streptomyces sp. HPF1205]|uniref:pentapeptide repeat-containing protein n=1 Tax=Streptomyces sp. HPF1205 TaxID=2873262 RepID=UPI001CEDF724|nr:pentapeptide repeat-containing protein [Streptomyces sp. HPF1205]